MDANTDFGWYTADAFTHQRMLLPAIVKSLGARPRTILDLGCGNGWLSEQYRIAGHHVTACDRAEDGLSLARAAFPLVRFHRAEVYDDLSALGFFDAVVCSEVIEHLYRPAAMIERAFQALRPGGVFIVTTPYHGYLKNLALSVVNKWDHHFSVTHDGGHIKFFSRRSLENMLRDIGFDPIAFVGVGRAPLLWKSMVVTARKDHGVTLTNSLSSTLPCV